MSFVPVGPTKVEKEDAVINCVNCPVKALVKENGTYFCTHNFNVSKNAIIKTSLGDVPRDVIANCQSCSLVSKKIEDVDVVVTRNLVKCPMTGVLSPVKACAKCACFATDKNVAHLSTMDKESEIDKISCTYPNVDFKEVTVKFTPTKKKNVLGFLKATKGVTDGR